MTDDLFTPLTPPNPAAPKPKCRVHRWTDATIPASCARCGRARDDVVVRRGRTNRSRGNAIERAIGKALGLDRVGQYGGPDDLRGPMFAVQVKSGGSFPERFWSWLRRIPAQAGQTPLLVVTDAPGPGHRRRAVVVLSLDSWLELHGPAGVADPLTLDEVAS